MSRLRLLREGWPSWLPMQPTGLMPPPSIAWQSFLHGQPENGKRNIQWAHKKAYRHLEFPAKQLTNRAALAHCVAVDTWAGSRGPLSFWHGSLASLCLCCGLLCVVFRAARFQSCAERPSHILTLSVPPPLRCKTVPQSASEAARKTVCPSGGTPSKAFASTGVEDLEDPWLKPWQKVAANTRRQKVGPKSPNEALNSLELTKP